MICMARTLGAPTRVPAGKVAANRSKASRPAREPPAYAAHHVHDMAVALDRTIGLDATLPASADAPEVVARQVDQHDVLGVLLGIGAQLLRAPRRPRVRARGRVPAMGRSCAAPSLRCTSASGEEPTTCHLAQAQ